TSLSFDHQRVDINVNNERGPQNGAVRASFESYAAGSGTGSTFSPTTSAATAHWDFTDPVAASDATFRIYGWNATSPGQSPANGSLRLDNITVHGELIALARMS